MSIATMAKKKTPSAQQPADGRVNAKLRASLHRRAKIVATWRGVDLEDYLHSVLAPAVERDFAEMVREDAEANRPTK